METGGATTGVDIKINIVFLVGKFMKNFNYKFEEVMDLNWFLFNDLLDSLKGVRIERETQELKLYLSELIIEKSKEKQNSYDNILENKKEQFKKYTEYDTTERDIAEMEAIMLKRSNRRGKNG